MDHWRLGPVFRKWDANVYNKGLRAVVFPKDAKITKRSLFFLSISITEWIYICFLFLRRRDVVDLSSVSRWWFQILFIFTPTWGNDPFWNDPFWLIFWLIFSPIRLVVALDFFVCKMFASKSVGQTALGCWWTSGITFQLLFQSSKFWRFNHLNEAIWFVYLYHIYIYIYIYIRPNRDVRRPDSTAF